MSGISFLSSTTSLNSDLLLLHPPSPPALLHRYRSYASSVSPVGTRRFLLAYRSAICTPRTSFPSLTKKTISCQAVRESTTSSQESQLYQGVYGPWTVEPSDVREVILYRSGLVTAAASFVLASSVAFLPNHGSGISDLITGNLDLLYTLGACGLGLSLYLIHIYVTEIKRTLQALWLLGAFGSFATYISFAQPAGKNLVEYVIENPTAIWLIGPLFASLTGLVFKEGLCYGKLEAGILTFIIPSVLLGHLSGLMDDGVKVTLLGVWIALFVVFAGRKFSQPIKDDIGDKSIFIFNALSEEEKKALVEKLEQQNVDSLN